jgi:heme oxygenase
MTPAYPFRRSSELREDLSIKQLREFLGQGASFRFYDGGHGQFETAWASFREDLEENGKNDVEAICSTAAAIFHAYADWLSGPSLRNRGV